MFFNMYPYTNFHELNLDEILRLMRELHHEWDEFTAVNKITNDGAWDITKQYQAWTVVSDNNIGYISLKPVPVGVAITNIEYWGVIADYNIFITDLSNRISILEGQMAGALYDISNLNTDVSHMKNRHFLVVGDSYMAQDNTPGDYDYTSWKAPHFMQKTMNVPDSQFHLFAQSGTSFAGGSFLTQIQDPAALALADVITDIVVVGGLNDSNQTTTDIMNGMSAFLTYARANYPYAKRIYLGYAGSADDTSAALSGRTVINRIDTRFLYEIRGAEMGYTIIPDLVKAWDFGLSWFYTGDYVHPSFNSVGDDTECGAALLGRAIGNFVMGGSVTTDYPVNQISLGSNDLLYTFDKENFTIMAPNATDNFITLSFPAQSMGYIVFNNGIVQFNKKLRIDTRAVVLYNNGGNANIFDVALTFHNKNITIQITSRDSNGQDIVLSNVTSIYLQSLYRLPRNFVA